MFGATQIMKSSKAFVYCFLVPHSGLFVLSEVIGGNRVISITLGWNMVIYTYQYLPCGRPTKRSQEGLEGLSHGHCHASCVKMGCRRWFYQTIHSIYGSIYMQIFYQAAPWSSRGFLSVCLQEKWRSCSNMERWWFMVVRSS